MNVLLTAIGGPAGICFAKSLREIDGARIIGVNAEPDVFGAPLVDRFHVVPSARDPGYLGAIRALVAHERIDFIVPLVDEEIAVLSAATSLGAPLLVSSERAVAHTSNKLRSYDVLEDFLPKRYQKSEARAFPLFAKPHIGRGGAGTRTIRSAADMNDLSDNAYLFQELLDEPEISADAVFALDGTLLGAVPRIRSRIDQGISVRGEVFESEAIVRMITEIAARLHFRGPVNFQFMHRKGALVLIEINPRASGGLGISTQSGIDIPKICYDIMAGREPLVGVMRPGVYHNYPEVIARQHDKRARTKAHREAVGAA